MKYEATKMVMEKAHHWQGKLMGCHFVISAVDADPGKAWKGIKAGIQEIVRIENMISSWSEESFTASINRNAGIQPITVPHELFHLIQRSIRVSELTTGAFDISGSLARDYWNFDRTENDILAKDKIENLRDLIDYRNIVLNENEKSVFLKKEGMKIGFGGIGKGYAAYRSYVVMKNMGIKSGLINASGDLMAWGNPPGEKFWSIQIPDPNCRKDSRMSIKIPYGSVVTSGNFENYCLIEGEKYSHIVDPRTGMPVKDISAVTVISPNPEFGDALATALSVMGWDDGIALTNQLKGVECILYDREERVYYSDGIAAIVD